MELESNLMNAYLQAYNIACEKLKISDPEKISLNTGTVYNKATNSLSVKYLNEDYTVDCSTGEITSKSGFRGVTTTVKVLILHYLINSVVRPLSGKLISFKEIPGGGAIYYNTFYQRAISPLIKTFADNFEVLYKAAEKLGGIKENYGHASITIRVFPLVPVTYVLWQGDEELSPSGTILFDDSITNFLPGEDIVLAASFGVYALMALATGK